LSRDELFSTVRGNAEVCELAAASLVNVKRLERQGTVFARAGWSARLSDRDQQLSERVSAAFKAAGLASPAAADLATTLGEALARVE
jgi:hypothetical protein